MTNTTNTPTPTNPERGHCEDCEAIVPVAELTEVDGCIDVCRDCVGEYSTTIADEEDDEDAAFISPLVDTMIAIGMLPGDEGHGWIVDAGWEGYAERADGLIVVVAEAPDDEAIRFQFTNRFGSIIHEGSLPESPFGRNLLRGMVVAFIEGEA